MALVICNGLPRSGSTWQYNIARTLVESVRHGVTLRNLYVDLFNEENFLACVHADKWYVVKMHEPHPFAPPMLAARNPNLRVLYIYRDLRDVAASLQMRSDVSGATLEEELRRCVDYHKTIMQYPRSDHFLIQTYERMMANPHQAVREISRTLLGMVIPEEAVDALVEAWSIDSVERRLAELREAARNQGIDLVQHDDRPLVEPQSQLHVNHISPKRGKIGSWREVLSPEDQELAERYYRLMMS